MSLRTEFKNRYLPVTCHEGKSREKHGEEEATTGAAGVARKRWNLEPTNC